MREALVKGDAVRFHPAKIYLYRQIYQVTVDDVLVVEHVEPRSGRRVLYLRKRADVSSDTPWIPVYPSALLRAGKAKKPL